MNPVTSKPKVTGSNPVAATKDRETGQRIVGLGEVPPHFSPPSRGFPLL